MRLLRRLAVLSVLTLLVVGASSAGQGNGVLVFRGTGFWIWWFNSDGQNLAVFSPEEYFGAGICDQPTGEWLFMDVKGVWNPNLPKQNWWAKGPHFTRVYPGVNPDTYPGWKWEPEFLCSFLRTAPAAEGISEVQWLFNNDCSASGPSRFTWSNSAHGMLYTPTAVCSRGMAKFDMVLKWMASADAYVDPVTCALDDPSPKMLVNKIDLKCIGQ